MNGYKLFCYHKSGNEFETVCSIFLYPFPLAAVLIECLKRSGLEIKDIKRFFQWVMEGPSSYGKRKEMFETRKAAVEDEIKALERTLALLKFKCWYYETAIKDGNEDGINAMLPDKLP